ncbi:MAG: fumarylacetoacetate hydrolase family protein [Bacteroidaceae bacterium]|nr:fumarylacetoacetate hydrolase family protein [Bacteroidaceae bacterium]
MKIFGIGMNYAKHNIELGDTLYKEREAPVVFTKADSALLKDGKPFFVPSFTQRCEYETELVVRICRLGRSIAPRWAHRYYDAVTVGIDFTARDLQREFRAKGLPWDLCKGFDGSAAIGEWVPKDRFADVQNIRFHMDLNGQTVQRGHTAEMLTGVDELVSYISRFFTLKMGDLIFTGTPAGVGTVKEGDHIEGFLEERRVLEFNVR